MKNKEILQKAIEKAVKNEWKEGLNYLDSWFGSIGIFEKSWTPIVIFSHDFAKSFWGIGKCHCGKNGHPFRSMDCPKHQWQYHLQQMVISDDPIKYLEMFL